MRSTKAFCKFLLILFVFALTVGIADAQDDPNFEVGLKPYGSYQAGEIDNVSMLNGSLGVDIPLISYPQRGGKLNLDFSMHYLNSSGFETEWCDDDGCYDYWALTQGGFSLIDKGAAFETPPYGNEEDTPAQFMVGDMDGSDHPLGEISGTNLLESVDATAYRVHSGGSTVPFQTITDRQGTVFNSEDQVCGDWNVANLYTYITFPTCELPRTDSNGNEISFSSTSGWTDSLGRVISLPTTTTDYSNCPNSSQVTYAVLWSPPGYNSGSYNLEFCYFTDSTTNYTLLQSIVLPNTTTWQFQWEPYLLDYEGTTGYLENLTQITFPTGGTLSYEWGASALCIGSNINDANMAVTTRTLNPSSSDPSEQWTYSYSTTSGVETTTVTDHENNETVHTLGGGSTACSLPYETEKQVYQGLQSGGNILETTNTTYSYVNTGSGSYAYNEFLDVVPTEVKITDNVGEPYSDVKYTYDSGFSFKYFGMSDFSPFNSGGAGSGYTSNYGDVLTKKEYSSGGSLLRTTTNTYLPFSNSTYLTDNFLDLLSSAKITDSGGTQRAYTTYCYDGSYGSCSGSESLNTTSGLPEHTSSPDGNYRGNLSTTSRWLNESTTSTSNCGISVSNSYLVNYNWYNDTGTTNYSVDFCGANSSDSNHKTAYTYDSTAGAYLTEIQYPPTGSASHSESFTNDFNTGLIMTHTDQNGEETQYTYDDMLRVLTITDPDGGGASYCYMDTSSSSCGTSVPSFTFTKKITTTPSTENFFEVGVVDGVGRLIQTQTTSPSSTCSGGVVYVDVHYDDMGNNASVSNPDCSTSSDELTTTLYNAMGQPCLVIPPDGTSESSCPSSAPANDIFTSFSGEWTIVTDEAGRTRKSQVDELGHLVSVIEDPSGLDYTTNYTYDALDDLASVSENSSRSRTFTYDSLTHRTSASNPESGATCYGTLSGSTCNQNGYDADGNLIKRTDARGTLTTSSYDNLDRLTENAYSDSTPSAYYYYDGLSPTACTISGFSYGSYTKPWRTAMCDGPGNEAWSHDIMGRIATDQRTTNSVTTTTTYTNNYDGSVRQMQYPSGDTFVNTWDIMEHLTSTEDSTNSINYGNSATYIPAGKLTSLTNGSGSSSILSSIYYDLYRLLPCRIAVNTSGTPPGSCSGTNYGNVLDLAYSFDLSTVNTTCSTSFGSPTNNEDVASITNNITGGRSQSFCYDSLDRLSTAQTASTYSTGPSYCWGESYTIDAWANLTAITPMTGSYSGCSQESGLSISVNTSNQISTSGFGYDSAGNMTSGPTSGDTYTYNAENEMTQAAVSSTVGYVYDGDGKRVEKTSGGTVTKIYWYDTSGNVLDETDGSGSTSNSSFYEYVFFNGSRIARRDSSSNVLYYFSDNLGTSREIVQSGSTSPCYDADLYPFGGERAYTNTCSQNYKFTGKERDSESNLDNFTARYFGSGVGRFMSPDPSHAFEIRQIDPQRWNMYAYAINSPLSYNDPTGQDVAAVNFSSMVAPGAGHEAFLVVDSDGSTTFASFGPTSSGPSAVVGKASSTLEVANSIQPASMSILPTVQFGTNGNPTADSVKALITALAKIKDVDPSTVRLNYFKTKEADTQRAKNFIDSTREAIAEGHGPFCYYNIFTKNCADFAAAGLVAAGVITSAQGNSLSFVPNNMFNQLGNFGIDEFDLLELSAPPPNNDYGILCGATGQPGCID